MASSIIPKALNGDISSLNDALANTNAALTNYTHTLPGYDPTYITDTNSAHFYKVGRIVYCTGYWSFKSGVTIPVDTVFATIPTGYRPAFEWTIVAQRPNGTGENDARVMRIKQNGDVDIHNGSSLVGGFLRFSGAYLSTM